MRSRLQGLVAALLVAAVPAAAGAKVYHSRVEALDLEFPDAERIESETHVLSDLQVARVQELSRGPVDSKLVKLYTGMKGDEVLGYAFIDIHTVRTLPEAFMVVLTPEGEVRSLRLLAFHEPLEYQPTRRWYDQFDRKSLEQPLRVGGDIHGVVGATLTARATTRGVRRALALYDVLVRTGR
jgi:Na+-translocating ferredoxin:NAD+ oxidoreductase RnfG subunit